MGSSSHKEHLGIGKQGIDAVLGKTVDAEAVGGDDGETTGHGLEDGHAPRLVARGEQKHIMTAVQARQVFLQAPWQMSAVKAA